ncbi:hypothetical protein NXY55_27750, partial [Aeromonas veronii]|nr:hypothetical protein [Aeromonas veronii]
TQFANHVVESAPYNSIDELPEEIKSLIHVEEDKNIYIQRDNTPAFISLTEEVKASGVIFTDIHTAAREHSDLLQKYFMKEAVKVDEHRLTALHAALVNGGAFVYVPKNVEVSVPLHAVFIQENGESALFNHVIVVAEDNSSVTYVENYISTTDSSNTVVNIVSEVIAGSN